MAEPFIGQIISTGFNYAPVGYALCNGELLNISQYTALFSLIGTTFGGDGQTTFALPDLRGRASVSQGTGPGLSTYVIGQAGGEINHTLVQNEMPTHIHMVVANDISSNAPNPTNAYYGVDSSIGATMYSTNAPNTAMNSLMLNTAGGNQPHNNMQPYLVISFSIALEGIYPSRN